MSNIYILSEPVASGKTTVLLTWLAQQPAVKGVCCPDIGGMRKLYIIGERLLFPLQTDSPGNEPIVRIGRFNFLINSFARGRQSMLQLLTNDAADMLVDEAGKLEMEQQQGFEPALTQVIAHYKNSAASNRLIIVIRDYLLDKAIAHYGLHGAKVIKKAYFELPQHQTIYNEVPVSINGIVLCGGASSRMGSPKALLQYNGSPQYEHTYKLLANFCGQVHISCKQEQAGWFNPTLPQIADDDAYKHSGPIAALLTATNLNQTKPLLVLGCDYPNISHEDIELLVNTFHAFQKSCCYVNDEQQEEPLLAVYHPNDLAKLKQFYSAGEQSLKVFLRTVQAVKIVAPNLNRLRSFDTLEDYGRSRIACQLINC